ncbi:MAG: hypothetical protein ACYC46_02585 [Acidobacteriaceae bacterium]
MDTVRLGRRLGIGTRLAAKLIGEKLDAATAPVSASSQKPPAAATVSSAVNTARKTTVHAVKTVEKSASAARSTLHSKAPQYQAKGRALARGSKRFGEAIWGPFVHAGGVLGLEIAGVFFALFAIFFGQNAWKLRSNLHTAGIDHVHFLIYTAVFFAFAYFSLSSFVRASKKSRKR